MSLQSYIHNDVHFGFNLDAEANAHLQRAAATVTSRKDSLEALRQARQSAPNQLEVLIALYKFHFYQGDLQKSEEIVFQTLVKASVQGGFSNEWKELTQDSSDWSDPRGPGRVFLYSLKALAFIRLRQNNQRDARRILSTLKRLDPQDMVGADVIRDLLKGLSR